MKKLFQVLTFVLRKAWSITKNVNKVRESLVAIEVKRTTFEQWVTKMFGGTSAGVFLGKEASDAAVGYACDGCGFDALQFVACFVFESNITAVITLPMQDLCLGMQES